MSAINRNGLALLLLLTGFPVGAQEAGDKWGLAALMQVLGEVETSQSHFFETKTLAYLQAPVRLEGTLSYRAPDYLKKQVLEPRRESYEVRGRRLLVDNGVDAPREVHLDDYPVIHAFVESFRATLAGDLKSLQANYWVKLQGGQNDWTLSLEPVDEDVANFVSAIVLRGQGEQVLSIETRETGGDNSLMSITSIVPPIDATP